MNDPVNAAVIQRTGLGCKLANASGAPIPLIILTALFSR